MGYHQPHAIESRRLCTHPRGKSERCASFAFGGLPATPRVGFQSSRSRELSHGSRLHGRRYTGDYPHAESYTQVLCDLFHLPLLGGGRLPGGSVVSVGVRTIGRGEGIDGATWRVFQ